MDNIYNYDNFNSIGNSIRNLLSIDLFNQLCTQKSLPLVKYYAFTSFLVSQGIGYDASFSPGTSRDAASIQLVIYINPTTKIQITISLEGGNSIYNSGGG